jgi:hypothetical protein
MRQRPFYSTTLKLRHILIFIYYTAIMLAIAHYWFITSRLYWTLSIFNLLHWNCRALFIYYTAIMLGISHYWSITSWLYWTSSILIHYTEIMLDIVHCWHIILLWCWTSWDLRLWVRLIWKLLSSGKWCREEPAASFLKSENIYSYLLSATNFYKRGPDDRIILCSVSFIVYV